MTATVGTGLGKVILLGEHAVVYGHPALAGALALGVQVRVEPAPQPRVVVPAWGLAVDDGAAVAAIAAIAAALGRTGSFAVHADATVPSRAGLGSSAALCVAVARALGAADDAATEAAAQAGEQVFHGNPSGIDVALATRGGLGLFSRGSGFTPLALPSFALVIGLSGEPRDTAARVADVARQRTSRPAETDRLLGELGALAVAGAGAHDATGLGPLLDRAHELLAQLGLTTPTLDRLCALARAAGAHGAKLTGAGGGGAVLALAPGREEAIAAAWRADGFTAFIVDVGAA